MSYNKTIWVNGDVINASKLNNLENGVYDNDSHIGDLSQLDTTAKSDLVAAINEAAQSGGGGEGITSQEKSLILTLFSKAAYAEDDAGEAYDQLSALWSVYSITWAGTGYTHGNTSVAIDGGKTFSSTITASGGHTISTVTATMGGVTVQGAWNNGVVTIPNVTGDIVITVTTVQATVSSISAIYTQSGTVYTTDSLDSLKSDLVVTATYVDQSTSVVPSTDYTLSGTLAKGTSTITVSYAEKTTTFSVTVTELLPAGYTKLDYVWSYGNATSTPIYVNIGVVPTANTSFEYKFSRDTLPNSASGTNNGGHLCSTENYYVPFLRYGNNQSSGNHIEFFTNRTGTETYNTAVGYIQADTPVEFTAFVDGNNITVGGETLFSAAAGNVTPTKSLTLFTYDGVTNVASYLFIGKLYYMNIYENGTLIREFIPCKNGSNVVGLYDRVNEEFYSSATSYPLSAPA